jgi:hypothetical protein
MNGATVTRWSAATLCALTLGTLGLGCGGSDNNGGSDQGAGSVQPPRRGFQAGTVFLHAHLKREVTCNPVDWATGGSGQCPGYFIGGHNPFNETPGFSKWENVSAIPGGSQPAIKITTEVRNGPKVECYILSRASSACYTNYKDQKNHAVGQEGGPLSIDANDSPPIGTRPYILLRGFCLSGDALCTPH